MRILVIKNNKHKNSYTTCVHNLLEATARNNGYHIYPAGILRDAVATAENSITFLTLSPASSINKFIRQQQLSSFIKKNKIELLIQNAGFYLKQKRIPQLLIADEPEKLPPIEKISYSKIFLLTYSQAAKQAIADKGFTNIVHVVPFFADALFQPISWSMKQQVKIDYTESREYFFVPGSFKSIESVLKVLKAFSGFKKWQQSSMKLVMAGKLYVPQDDWEEKINTYKFREDVLIYNTLPEEDKAKLLAGAYACFHLPENDHDILPVLQSMQCHTPVITFETSSIQEYALNAALTATPGNYEELTQHMILIYKDENLRNKLVENCTLQAGEFSEDKAIQTLQKILL